VAGANEGRKEGDKVDGNGDGAGDGLVIEVGEAEEFECKVGRVVGYLVGSPIRPDG